MLCTREVNAEKEREGDKERKTEIKMDSRKPKFPNFV